jgi:hypothetical protein
MIGMQCGALPVSTAPTGLTLHHDGREFLLPLTARWAIIGTSLSQWFAWFQTGQLQPLFYTQTLRRTNPDIRQRSM